MVYSGPHSPSLVRRHSVDRRVSDECRFTPEHILNVSAQVEDSESLYRVIAEVPGIKPENVHVEVNGKYLVISGEVYRDDEEDEDYIQQRKRGILFSASSVDRFVRKFILPRYVDLGRVDAGVSKTGKLVVTMPKNYVYGYEDYDGLDY
jgi:HSP20 family molecular chaperone IbpA